MGFDFDSTVYLLVGLSRMTAGASIFFAVVACCMFMLANRAIDIALCAVKTVGRWIQTAGYAIGDVLFASVEDEIEIEREPELDPQPKARRSRGRA